MKRFSLLPAAAAAVLLLACTAEDTPRDEGASVSDDGEGETGEGETSAGGSEATSAASDAASTTGDDDAEESGSEDSGNDTTAGPIDPRFDCDDVVDGPFATETFVQGISAGGPIAFDGAGGMIVTEPGEPADIVRYNRFETDGSSTMLLEAPNPWVTFLAKPDGVWVPTLEDGLREYSANAKPLGTIAVLDPAGSLARDGQGRTWLVDHARVGQIDSGNFVATSGSSANAVAVDPVGRFVYWTDATNLYRIVVDASGPLGEQESMGPLGIDNAAGLTSDTCGNLYVVQQHPLPSQLIRVRVDGQGQVTRTPLLAEPGAHAGAPLGRPVFGRGFGFSETSVFMVKLDGASSEVVVVDLDVPAADS